MKTKLEKLNRNLKIRKQFFLKKERQFLYQIYKLDVFLWHEHKEDKGTLDYGFKELLILQNFLPCKKNTQIFLNIKFNSIFVWIHKSMMVNKKPRRQWHDEKVTV